MLPAGLHARESPSLCSGNSVQVTRTAAAWAALSVFLLVACDPYVDPRPHIIVASDGTRWYSVDCRPMADCYQAAVAKCANGEYLPSPDQQRDHVLVFRCRTGVRTE